MYQSMCARVLWDVIYSRGVVYKVSLACEYGTHTLHNSVTSHEKVVVVVIYIDSGSR